MCVKEIPVAYIQVIIRPCYHVVEIGKISYFLDSLVLLIFTLLTYMYLPFDKLSNQQVITSLVTSDLIFNEVAIFFPSTGHLLVKSNGITNKQYFHLMKSKSIYDCTNSANIVV